MMKQTISKRVYKCKCGTLNECYVWDIDLITFDFKCVKCFSLIGYKQLNTKKVIQTTSIRTPTKNR